MNIFFNKNKSSPIEQSLPNNSSPDVNKHMYTLYKESTELNMQPKQFTLNTTNNAVKTSMQLLRRFILKISNISLTPLISGINSFLQFTVGGNYSISVYKNKVTNDKYNIIKGKRGFVDKTEVILYINNNPSDLTKVNYTKVIETELRMSYTMIEKEKLMIELWQYNGIMPNSLISHIVIPLIDIAKGSEDIKQLFYINNSNNTKSKTQYAILEFNCVFEEIWDFHFALSNVVFYEPTKQKLTSNKNESMKYTLHAEFQGKKTSSSTLLTPQQESISNTHIIWNSFDNELLFRGTISQLESKEIIFTAYYKKDSHLIRRNNTLFKTVLPLYDIVHSQSFKCVLPSGSYLEGNITFDNIPQYQQMNKKIILFSNKRYLHIKVLSVSNIVPVYFNKGIVNSFVNCNWNSINLKTRTVNESNNPIFNEDLFFQIPSQITSFSILNNVELTLFIEDNDGTVNNVGSVVIKLNKQNFIKEEHKVYYDDIRREMNIQVDKTKNEFELTSLMYSTYNKTVISVEICFIPYNAGSFIKTVNDNEKQNATVCHKLLIPEMLKNMLVKGSDYSILDNVFNERIKLSLNHLISLPLFKHRYFNILCGVDRSNIKLKQYLPYYLNAITLPTFTNNNNKHKYNIDLSLNSIDAIAHYVRCFPFSLQEQFQVDSNVYIIKDNEIECSNPNYMFKCNKGNEIEHAILMACLIIGLQYSCNTTSSSSESTGENKSNTNCNSNKVNNYEELSNRVFVCLGKLKGCNELCCWVMVIDSNYENISFYDPKIFLNVTLHNRTKEPNKLQRFLNGKYDTYNNIHNDKNECKINKENEDNLIGIIIGENDKNKNLNEIEIKESINYNNQSDFGDSYINDAESILFNKTNNIKDINAKLNSKHIIDKYITAINNNNNNDNISEYTYLSNSIMNMQTLNKENNTICYNNIKQTLPIETFTNYPVLPYETIDLIFNSKNIWANLQYYSPERIYYNIYNKNEWLPLFAAPNEKDINTIINNINSNNNNNNSFYTIDRIDNVYPYVMLNKLEEWLKKEVRVSVATFRKEKGLSTRFKSKNEKISFLVEEYLDYIEGINLGKISSDEFQNEIIKDWEVLVKKYIPINYKFDIVDLFCNYYERQCISNLIYSNLEYFWNDKIKNVMFVTGGRVYSYPNRILSIRIGIAKIYKQSYQKSNYENGEEIENLKEEKDDDGSENE